MKKQFFIWTFFMFSACGFYPENSVLSKYDFSGKSNSIKLSHKLREISGITVTKDNRLFAHDDEISIIYQLDLKTGGIIKQFSVGKNPIYSDFEDIAFVNNKFYLITSNGYLYEFKEGGDKSAVGYKRYDTGLTTSYDIEGLCYDAETNSLLLACKDYPGKGLKDVKSIYAFSLESNQLVKKPRFLVNLEELKKRFKIKNFQPSGIEKNLQSGTFFILSANENALVEISPKGEILDAEKISKKNHPQPEGITFLSDKTLVISDEGGSKGLLTFYKHK